VVEPEVVPWLELPVVLPLVVPLVVVEPPVVVWACTTSVTEPLL